MGRIYKSRSRARTIITYTLAVILAALVIYGAWSVAETLANTHSEESIAAIEKAIVKSAVQCYALEGRYPTGIQYLEEHYGLTLDKDKYVYHYESIGENMVPDVKVYPL